MNRREFLKGIGSVAIVAACPLVSLTDRYEHRTYSLAYSITRQDIEDGAYEEIGKRYAEALAQSMAQTKERVIANVLNRAFDVDTDSVTVGTLDELMRQELAA